MMVTSTSKSPSTYRGMRWLKCDLHLHTPEDSKNWADPELKLGNPRRPKVNGAPDDDDIQEKARVYLGRCHALGLDIIGVTDHNFAGCAERRDCFLTHLIEQNKTVAKAVGREPLWIFPGFEVDIGYHVICLFPPTQKNSRLLDHVEESLNLLGLTPTRRFESGEPRALRVEDRTVSLRELLHKVQKERGGIVIAAHAFSDKGICDGPTHRSDYLLQELLCVEVSHEPLGGIREEQILMAKSGEWARPKGPPAWIMSSDAKSLAVDDDGAPRPNSLGYRHTWIKMSEPSIESLRQAFLDPESRIRRPKDTATDRSPEEGRRHDHIASLQTEQTRFLDDMELALSPGLNCLVGGRGTGKSTLLEYARLCLRREDQARGRAAEQVKRIRGTLTDDSLLRMVWHSADDLDEHLEVMGRSTKALLTRVVDAPEVVFARMNVQLYSQGELSELTGLDEHRQPIFLLKLVDQLCGDALVELKHRESELRSDIETMLTRRRALEGKRARLRELRQDEAELTRQWSTRAEVREEAERHRRAREAGRYVEKVERDTADWARRVLALAEELVEAHAPLGSVVARWPEPRWFEGLDEGWEAAKERLAADIRAAVGRFETTVDGLAKGHEAWPTIDAAIAATMTAFEEACEQRGLTPEDIDRLQGIEQERRVKQNEIERLEREIAIEERDVAAIADKERQLHAVWWKQHRARREKAEELNHSAGVPTVEPEDGAGERSFVTLSFTYMGERQSFERVWTSLAPDGRSKLGRSWQDVGEALYLKHVEAIRSDETRSAPSGSPWDLLEGWLTDPSKMPLEQRGLATEIGTYLQETIRERWELARLDRVQDAIDLQMYRPDGTLVGALQEGKLSDGQRNTAALAILLAAGAGPVLIDQPEDELDSAFIYQQLVPLLRKVKEHRQIVVVTHNPNIPVNADAELVIALETKDGRGVVRAQGGLDRAEVSKAVLDIMEGSGEAFRKRREKYRF
jgi:ABC-type lipoprotein export system ATPase subunit